MCEQLKTSSASASLQSNQELPTWSIFLRYIIHSRFNLLSVNDGHDQRCAYSGWYKDLLNTEFDISALCVAVRNI